MSDIRTKSIPRIQLQAKTIQTLVFKGSRYQKDHNFAALLCQAHRGRFSHMSPEEAISFGPLIERANVSCEMV